MVELLDSTLREGEQTPGVAFSLREKVEIARLLDEFGVDFIEVGHPAVSPDVEEAVRRLAALKREENLHAKLLAHCRAMKDDIDLAVDCGADWVGIFLSVTDRSLEERFRKTLSEAEAMVVEAVEHARSRGVRVRYTPEDATRTAPANLIRIARAAAAAGAGRISIADTAGVMTPARMQGLVKALKKRIPVPLHVHCHNDLGMATANALAALESGARLADVTVNGLGERTGITPLAELTVALKVLYGVRNKWRMDLLPRLAAAVERASGLGLDRLTPVVGRYAFTHTAGLHAAAVLKNPQHYEVVPAEMVGRRREFVLNRMVGKAALRHELALENIALDDGAFENLYRFVKSAQKVPLMSKDLRKLAAFLARGGVER